MRASRAFAATFISETVSPSSLMRRIFPARETLGA